MEKEARKRKPKSLHNQQKFTCPPTTTMVSFQILIQFRLSIINPALHSKADSLVDHLSLSLLTLSQLIFSAFKTLTNQQVTIELKNDLAITGTLKSVDQFLNFRVDEIKVEDPERWPHMVSYSYSSNADREMAWRMRSRDKTKIEALLSFK